MPFERLLFPDHVIKNWETLNVFSWKNSFANKDVWRRENETFFWSFFYRLSMVWPRSPALRLIRSVYNTSSLLLNWLNFTKQGRPWCESENKLQVQILVFSSEIIVSIWHTSSNANLRSFVTTFDIYFITIDILLSVEKTRLDTISQNVFVSLLIFEDRKNNLLPSAESPYGFHSVRGNKIALISKQKLLIQIFFFPSCSYIKRYFPVREETWYKKDVYMCCGKKESC